MLNYRLLITSSYLEYVQTRKLAYVVLTHFSPFKSNGLFHKQHTCIIKSGLSIVYIEGSQFIISKNSIVLSHYAVFIWVFAVAQLVSM